MEIKVPSFMTLHGLKVRLDMDFCLEYLKDNMSEPWSWSIEAYDSLKSIMSIIFIFICMYKDFEIIYIFFGTVLVYLIGYYISQSMLLMSIFMVIYVLPYKLYSIFQKLFLPYIVLIAVTFVTKNYRTLVVFVIARITCFVISYILNLAIINNNKRRFGIYMGDIEVTAYKSHLCFCDERLEVSNWKIQYSTFINGQSGYEG